jgi:hypothetical protein
MPTLTTMVRAHVAIRGGVTWPSVYTHRTWLPSAELSLHGEQAEYDVMLDRSEAAALREWCDEMCLEVEPPRVNQSDRDKLLAVAHAIDDALESAP